MTKEIAKQVLNELKTEQENKLKEELKFYISQTLKKLEEKKAEREVINEEIRILDKDLEDLKAGNLENIRERQQKSNLANVISQIRISNWVSLDIFKPIFTNSTWCQGTYLTPTKIYYL